MHSLSLRSLSRSLPDATVWAASCRSGMSSMCSSAAVGALLDCRKTLWVCTCSEAWYGIPHSVSITSASTSAVVLLFCSERSTRGHHRILLNSSRVGSVALSQAPPGQMPVVTRRTTSWIPEIHRRMGSRTRATWVYCRGVGLNMSTRSKLPIQFITSSALRMVVPTLGIGTMSSFSPCERGFRCSSVPRKKSFFFLKPTACPHTGGLGQASYSTARATFGSTLEWYGSLR
mmetsp:Transcript_33322/g.93469  ORF Transcript_33322/g.93469 Transcript_33322/m.93469 type:complete len:231 (-) Transcript_33322:1456-2148(-)